MDVRRSSPVVSAIARVVGEGLPIAIETYDGGRVGPSDPPATLLVRSPDALRRIVTAPGELGLGRAYVMGEIDVEGDIYVALSVLRCRLGSAVRMAPADLVRLATLLGPDGVRPLPPPPQEARLRGRRHSRHRDAEAISHHYDVSNDFYRLVLGPSMTYSCAVWSSPQDTLEEAQEAKHGLIAAKLELRPGMRLLDVGCGWGRMVIHAARHGVRAVGVTLSREQATWAQKAIAEEGLADLAEVRLQDYRDVRDGPYDAISSIGMFEHVGLRNLTLYFRTLRSLLRPEGRLLNHGIGRPARPSRAGARRPVTPPRLRRRSFIDRFVFPDGELHEVGSVVSTMQAAGFEVRHLESLREHYGLTLRAWVRNLEANWDEAVAAADEPRARIWRLYMAASALNFEAGRTQVHQVLAVKSSGGRSGFPLRPDAWR